MQALEVPRQNEVASPITHLTVKAAQELSKQEVIELFETASSAERMLQLWRDLGIIE